MPAQGKGLEPCIGSRARIAEVINQDRPLTLEKIRRFAAGLNLPAAVLIRGYHLDGRLESGAVSTGKCMFYQQLVMGPDDAYHYAADVMACNMMAEDAGEGIDAFMQKRHPVWKGK